MIFFAAKCSRTSANVQVMHQSNLGSGVANGIQNINGNDQEGKDFVGKAGGVLDVPVQVEKGRQEHVQGHPKSNPGIERQKGYVQVLAQFIGNGLKREDGSGSAIDHHGHARYNAVKDSTPSRGHE